MPRDTWHSEKIPQQRITLLLTCMLVFVPAVGSPTEVVLQDTVKSTLVSFFALVACLMQAWQLRSKDGNLRLHWIVALPVLLCAYSLGSAIWSHTYLGIVEFIRWLIFSLIVCLGINIFTRGTTSMLAWGIHIGATIASLWTALQFWFDIQWFAQGPNPASTFVNRNFFAEFAVCTLPFSFLLLTRLRNKISVFLITISIGFNITAILMTGTRSAILGLFLLPSVLIFIAVRVRNHLPSGNWSLLQHVGLIATLVLSIAVMGNIPTSNRVLLSESQQTTAIGRAMHRTASLAHNSEYAKGSSFSMRWAMWNATFQMILKNPIAGVGAGAWEAEIPRFQAEGSNLETDYYAHNEFLQLVAEYGLVGWLSIGLLGIYILSAAYKTWNLDKSDEHHEVALRMLTLASLLTLCLVSSAGFPWRLAGTGCIFAVCLGILAASDLRIHRNKEASHLIIRTTPVRAQILMIIFGIFSVLAMYIAFQAVECERKLVGAIKIATAISASGKPKDPRWNDAKSQMLQWTREGIEINPHYRKLTPIVADALASWDDWKNAIWIWESVLSSRPYIVAMIANVARGYLHEGNPSMAQIYLDRAKQLQPNSASVASLELLFWSQTGRTSDAIRGVKDLLSRDPIAHETVQLAYALGITNDDLDLAVLALETGIKKWPNRAVDGWLKLGNLYAYSRLNDPAKALECYRAALEGAQTNYRMSVFSAIPSEYRTKLLTPS